MNSARLAVIVLVAVVGFGAAFLLFRGDGDVAPDGQDLAAGREEASDSGHEGEGDAEESVYDVQVEPEPDPPELEGTVFAILVSREGESVTGATVQLRVEMREHAHAGVGETAEEVAPGRYESRLEFPMRGAWAGQVEVHEPGESPASTPVSFEVQ